VVGCWRGCLERVADLHTAQLMPLPLTVSCFSKIQIGVTFLVQAQLGSAGQRAVKRVYVLLIYSSQVQGLNLRRSHVDCAVPCVCSAREHVVGDTSDAGHERPGVCRLCLSCLHTGVCAA